MKKLIIILFTQIIVFPFYAQEKLIRFTYSIVDTSLTKTEQAKCIYNWMTNNISYDTKQLKNGVKYFSPLQTIKRKKAVCYGYSELFNEMCNILNIESYLIKGYSKGFGYTRGDDFLKADHSWNIVYADSNWLFIDATWGSGFLEYTYDFKSKLKQIVNKNFGIKSKVIFHKEPNGHYFNTTMLNFLSTHYPLDAKWQFLNYPVSYKTFISDTINNSEFLDYEREISHVRNMGVEYQLFIDGLNSVNYNPYNKFDIAYQYYYKAGQINFTKKTIYDSLLLSKLLKANDYYDLSSQNLKEFKTVNSTHYKRKKNFQKTNFRIGLNIIKKTVKITSLNNHELDKKFHELLKLDMDLSSAINDIGRFISHEPKNILYFFDTVSLIDTLMFNNYLEIVNIKKQKLNNYFIELKKLNSNTDSLSIKYRTFNDTILEPLELTCSILNNLKFSIDQMNEYQAYKSCSELNKSFKDYSKANHNKIEGHNQLLSHFNSFQKVFEVTNQTLNSLLELYSKLSKISGDNFKFKSDAEYLNTMVIELYKLYINILKNLKEDNESRINLLSDQHNIFFNFGSDGFSNLEHQLSRFYDFTTSENDKSYNENIDLYREIYNDIKKKRFLIKTAIREINKKHRLLIK